MKDLSAGSVIAQIHRRPRATVFGEEVFVDGSGGRIPLHVNQDSRSVPGNLAKSDLQGGGGEFRTGRTEEVFDEIFTVDADQRWMLALNGAEDEGEMEIPGQRAPVNPQGGTDPRSSGRDVPPQTRSVAPGSGAIR